MHYMKLMRNFLLLSDRTKLMNALLLPLLDYADVTFSDATGGATEQNGTVAKYLHTLHTWFS